MNEQRVAEFHKTGASHEEQEQAIPVYNVYEDESGRVEVFGPPAIFMSGPPATVHKPTYYFDLYGQRKEVIDICTRYVTILTKLLQEFWSKGVSP